MSDPVAPPGVLGVFARAQPTSYDTEVLMNEPSAHHPGQEADAQGLRELHRLYLEFMAEFRGGRRLDYPGRDYAGFAAWWRRLDPAVRQICENDFRKGYAKVLAESEGQVAAVLARYEHPRNGSQ
jgi:hypothetical protein